MAARYDPFVRAGWIALIVSLALVGCGSPRGDSVTSRQVLVSDIRSTETLVVGHVFTELMTDDEIVAAALALCDMERRLGRDAALEEAIAAVRSLDWDAPANSSMLSRLLQVGAASVCGEPDASAETPLAEVLPPRPQIGSGSTAADVDASIAGFLDTTEGGLFIATIREHEARYPGVFTATMSDDELVVLARGICQTIGELGLGADDELRRYREAYGWTSDADSGAFALIVDSSDPVCITVGS